MIRIIDEEAERGLKFAACIGAPFYGLIAGGSGTGVALLLFGAYVFIFGFFCSVWLIEAVGHSLAAQASIRRQIEDNNNSEHAAETRQEKIRRWNKDWLMRRNTIASAGHKRDVKNNSQGVKR